MSSTSSSRSDSEQHWPGLLKPEVTGTDDAVAPLSGSATTSARSSMRIESGQHTLKRSEAPSPVPLSELFGSGYTDMTPQSSVDTPSVFHKDASSSAPVSATASASVASSSLRTGRSHLDPKRRRLGQKSELMAKLDARLTPKYNAQIESISMTSAFDRSAMPKKTKPDMSTPISMSSRFKRKAKSGAVADCRKLEAATRKMRRSSLSETPPFWESSNPLHAIQYKGHKRKVSLHLSEFLEHRATRQKLVEQRVVPGAHYFDKDWTHFRVKRSGKGKAQPKAGTGAAVLSVHSEATKVSIASAKASLPRMLSAGSSRKKPDTFVSRDEVPAYKQRMERKRRKKVPESKKRESAHLEHFFSKRRPLATELERTGIVPIGVFEDTEAALERRRHRRRATAEDLERSLMQRRLADDSDATETKPSLSKSGSGKRRATLLLEQKVARMRPLGDEVPSTALQMECTLASSSSIDFAEAHLLRTQIAQLQSQHCATVAQLKKDHYQLLLEQKDEYKELELSCSDTEMRLRNRIKRMQDENQALRRELSTAGALFASTTDEKSYSEARAKLMRVVDERLAAFGRESQSQQLFLRRSVRNCRKLVRASAGDCLLQVRAVIEDLATAMQAVDDSRDAHLQQTHDLELDIGRLQQAHRSTVTQMATLRAKHASELRRDKSLALATATSISDREQSLLDEMQEMRAEFAKKLKSKQRSVDELRRATDEAMHSASLPLSPKGSGTEEEKERRRRLLEEALAVDSDDSDSELQFEAAIVWRVKYAKLLTSKRKLEETVTKLSDTILALCSGHKT